MTQKVVQAKAKSEKPKVGKEAEAKKAAKALAQRLQALPDTFVVCRDVRHAWSVENDFRVTEVSQVGTRKLQHIARELVCLRCSTVRQEEYVMSKYGLEKVGQGYVYPEGYQIPGVPRGVKTAGIVQQEQYRRAMERVAEAARGERERAEQ